MLIDKNETSTHAVGINLDKGLIYDYKEKCVMELNINNLSVCFGQSMTFECFSKFGELWNLKQSAMARFHFFVGIYMHIHVYINTYFIVTLVSQPVRIW